MHLPPRRRAAPPIFVELIRAGRPIDLAELLADAAERPLTSDELELIKLGLIDERRLNIHALISASARGES